MGSNIIVVSSFVMIYCQVIRRPKVEWARVRGANVCVVWKRRVSLVVFLKLCVLGVGLGDTTEAGYKTDTFYYTDGNEDDARAGRRVAASCRGCCVCLKRK